MRKEDGVAGRRSELRQRLWAERLGRWLAEWRLDQALPWAAEADPRDVSPETTWTAPLRPWKAPQIHPGDIWLLPPWTAAARPLCVAVLALRDKERGLVAPFGRFSEPGLPGEWATGIDAPLLRVLCVWNTRWMNAAFIRRGWRAGRLSHRALERSAALRWFLACGAQLPRWLERETGPPLLHPADPRWVYQSEEASLLDEAVRAADTVFKRVSASAEYQEKESYASRGEEPRLAAEGHASYGTEAKDKPSES